MLDAGSSGLKHPALSTLSGDGKMSIYKKHVFVCSTGKTCLSQGAERVVEIMRKEIAERGLKKQIRINKSACLDQCGNGPIAVVYPEAIWYAGLNEEDAKEIAEKHLAGDEPVQRCFYDGRGKVV